MAELKYSGVNKGEDNRYKINNNILRMMNTNPALGTGYLIGSMLGENYWGKKRAKTRQETKDKFFGNQNGSIGADANGTYGTNNSTPTSTSNNKGYYDSMNEALEEYKQGNPNGKVLYSGLGSNVQTPQQANKPAVTTENAGNGGGVPTPADHWNNIMNASTYNPGSTGMYTNGARNLGNVIGADANGVYGVNSGPVIGADANGVYGVPNGGSAPSAANIPRSPQTKAPNPNPTPIPYTPEQLAQIQAYGKFTPEELKRMGAGELVAPPVQAVASAPSGGGYVAPAVANNAQATYTPNEVRGLEGNVAATGRPTLTPEAAGPLTQVMNAAANGIIPEDEAALLEARSVANNLPMAGATRAGAADYGSRFITPGHDANLEWHPFAYQPSAEDEERRARAVAYLNNMP